jgi:putative tricarboxylic transport membrane protein
VTKLVVLLMILVTGVTYTYSASEQGIGSLTQPGAGFFPVIIGLLIIAISVILLVQNLPRWRETLSKRDASGTEYLRPMILVLVGVAGYIVLLPVVHYPVATLVLCGYLMRLCGMKRWIHTGVFSAVISLSLYFGFTYLQVTLP